MKEKIIIDGVDVSGCEFYKEKIEKPYGSISSCKNYGYCTHNLPPAEISGNITYDIARCYGQKDCYYKQLARKTEELQAERRRVKELEEKYKYKQLLGDIKDIASKCMKYGLDKILQKVKEVLEGCEQKKK